MGLEQGLMKSENKALNDKLAEHIEIVYETAADHGITYARLMIAIIDNWIDNGKPAIEKLRGSEDE